MQTAINIISIISDALKVESEEEVWVTVGVGFVVLVVEKTPYI